MGTGRAFVVGSGPNGLAGAIVLARAGLDVTVFERSAHVGGATRSSEAMRDGLLHDHCSAVHPLAAGSPFFDDFGLESHGLKWRLPAVDCAHPLDDGSAGALYRSIDETAAQLGSDGRMWRRLLAAPSEAFDQLRNDLLRPLVAFPDHPVRLARFGAGALMPASVLARLFDSPRTKALWGGVAAHAYTRLDRPLTSSVGLGILAAGHRHGWPVAEGGSQRIADAMVAALAAEGGTVETGIDIRSFDQVHGADIVLWDTSPTAVLAIMADRLPSRVRRSYERFRYGPAAFKVDFAVEEGVPWRSEAARNAGTVHVGGTFDEIAQAEALVNAGRMPERPFVLVGQQYLADPGRSVGTLKPVWSYAHVPNGYGGDATEAVIAQIERFAPGFRERIIDFVVRRPGDLSAENANFVGGNILTGAKDPKQLVLGPRANIRPYDTGVDGHYLCSAATPPGPGAHGMCGYHAASRALSRL
ncbi:MAG: NAD(P)/FAD-dependent oxidoreductase [Acidimicrobiales bacterium]